MTDFTRRACVRKRKYLDRATAESTLRHMLDKSRQVTPDDRARLNAYECPCCRFWHLGKAAYAPPA